MIIYDFANAIVNLTSYCYAFLKSKSTISLDRLRSRYYVTKTNDDYYDQLINSIKAPNLDMSEILQKSEAVKDEHGYLSLTSYCAGNCWVNHFLSCGLELSGCHRSLIDGINGFVNKTEALSYPITLFHGFELFTYYKESTWKIGESLCVEGFLSKTPDVRVAEQFSRVYSATNLRYIVVFYPKGSKHVTIPRYPEEYEYLTFSAEKLKLVNIVKLFPVNNPFMCYKLYLCEPEK